MHFCFAPGAEVGNFICLEAKQRHHRQRCTHGRMLGRTRADKAFNPKKSDCSCAWNPQMQGPREQFRPDARRAQKSKLPWPQAQNKGQGPWRALVRAPVNRFCRRRAPQATEIKVSTSAPAATIKSSPEKIRHANKRETATYIYIYIIFIFQDCRFMEQDNLNVMFSNTTGASALMTRLACNQLTAPPNSAEPTAKRLSLARSRLLNPIVPMSCGSAQQGMPESAFYLLL